MKQCPKCGNKIGILKGLKKLKEKRVAYVFKKPNEKFSCMNCGVVLQREWSQLTLVVIGMLFSGYTYIVQNYSYDLLMVSILFFFILSILIALAIKKVSYEVVLKAKNNKGIKCDKR